MMHRCIAASLGALAVVILVVSFSSSTIAGQAPSSGARADATAAKAYVAPRTADGHPDLQGIWANNDATPLERPKELEGRQFLTDAEVAVFKKRAGELFNGESDAAFGDSQYLAVLKEAKDFKSTDTTGNYNHFWIVEREFDNRTALVTDPPDGRVPELTPQAKQRQAAAAEYRRLHPADGPEDLPLSHRCVTFGVPRLGAGYNSYFQILQSPSHVAIGQEMIHDMRLIPLDRRPHIDSSVTQWHGDPRGHWEGDTLVVDTTNFSDKSRFQGLSSDKLHVVERYTRIGPKTIQWDVTVNDPTVWTKPWTATVLLRSTPDPIFEMACHEGNEGLAGALRGHRALENPAAKTSSR
jgi:hypothetical protein